MKIGERNHELFSAAHNETRATGTSLYVPVNYICARVFFISTASAYVVHTYICNVCVQTRVCVSVIRLFHTLILKKKKIFHYLFYIPLSAFNFIVAILISPSYKAAAALLIILKFPRIVFPLGSKKKTTSPFFLFFTSLLAKS